MSKPSITWANEAQKRRYRARRCVECKAVLLHADRIAVRDATGEVFCQPCLDNHLALWAEQHGDDPAELKAAAYSRMEA